MINFEIKLDLRWTRNFILSEISKTSDVPAKSATNPPVPAREATITTSATFQVNNAKLYLLVVFLSINDNIKFLEHLKAMI